MFDYDGAAWADRHQDFRYLLFPGSADETMLDGALEIYEPLLGLGVSTGSAFAWAMPRARSAFWDIAAAPRPKRIPAGAPWPKTCIG